MAVIQPTLFESTTSRSAAVPAPVRRPGDVTPLPPLLLVCQVCFCGRNSPTWWAQRPTKARLTNHYLFFQPIIHLALNDRRSSSNTRSAGFTSGE